MDSVVEYEEVNTTTLEWTLRGIKTIFDSSRGESKSKVIKSIRFGGGKWQILFYPNSGTESGAYVSLYLSCEPAAEEKDNAINGKWMREGLYKFSFEMRTVGKSTLFNSKEACDHSFSYKTANWGWAQFARRDSVYYQSTTVKHHDAFLIICNISSSPSPPAVPSPTPRLYVPRNLLDAVGSLLDEPTYSDVEFILPGRGTRPPRTIWACRRLLRRAEYFETMFNSGFAEAVDSTFDSSVGNDTATEISAPMVPVHFTDSEANPFEDSDEEDEDDALDNDSPSSPTAEASTARADDDDEMANADRGSDDDEEELSDGRNVRAKLSHPSSPRGEKEKGKEKHRELQVQQTIFAPKKCRVVIKDVAYATYKAVLHYLYTDTIVFAPLSSTFLATAPQSSAQSSATSNPPASSSVFPVGPADNQPPASQSSLAPLARPKSALEQNIPEVAQPSGPKTRKEWIREWERANPNRVLPCSAKAVYRLADKLDLAELKNRAFQHIVKSLSVNNVPYEVFSSFSAAFEEVRKVQVDFFLANWSEIRGSEAMRNIWQQIRLGRHPGFEEVWPVIALNLEFRARNAEGTSGDKREVAGTGEA